MKKDPFSSLASPVNPKNAPFQPLASPANPKNAPFWPLASLANPKKYPLQAFPHSQTTKKTSLPRPCTSESPEKSDGGVGFFGMLVFVFRDFQRLLALSKDRKRISLALLFSLELKRLLLNGLRCSFRRRKIWFFICWLVWCYRWWPLGYISPLQSSLWSLRTKVLLVSWTIGRGSA